MCLGLRDILHFNQEGRTPISGLDQRRAPLPLQRILQRVQRRVPQLGPREAGVQPISHRRVVMANEPRVQDRQIVRPSYDESVRFRDRVQLAPRHVDLYLRSLTAARGSSPRRRS